LVRVDTFGSSYDTVLAVYTGSSVGALTAVGCNDDTPTSLQSRLTFSATAGTAYRIQVGGYNGATGIAMLNLTVGNDDFGNAVTLPSALPVSATTGTAGATTELGEALSCNTGSTVWYNFTPAVTTAVQIDTFGSSYDTVLGVYTGATIPSLTSVGCNDDSGTLQSRLSFVATAGTTYRIQVGGYGGATGTAVLNIHGGVTLGVKADLAIDFGTSGLWLLDNGVTWSFLHGLNPSLLATGDIDGNGLSDVIVDFAGFGVWAWMNNSSWLRIHSLNVTAMTTGDLDGNGRSDIVLDFPGFGVWVYFNNTSFSQLNPANSTLITTGDLNGDGRAEAIISFSAYGTWVWSSISGWTQIHSLPAVSLAAGDLDADGDADLLVGFAGFGVYMLRNGVWTQVHSLTPPRMIVADIDGNGQGDAVMDFTGFGVWARKNLTTWKQLHSLNAGLLAAADIDRNGQFDVILSFPGFGLWEWKNDSSYVQLHPVTPEGVAVGSVNGN
jgi:hypothetical protein